MNCFDRRVAVRSWPCLLGPVVVVGVLLATGDEVVHLADCPGDVQWHAASRCESEWSPDDPQRVNRSRSGRLSKTDRTSGLPGITPFRPLACTGRGGRI